MFSYSPLVELIKLKCVSLQRGVLSFADSITVIPDNCFGKNEQITHIQFNNVEIIQKSAFE